MPVTATVRISGGNFQLLNQQWVPITFAILARGANIPSRLAGLEIVSYSAKVLGQKTTLPQRKKRSNKPADNVMIVGHLPFLGKLVALLVTGSEENEIVEFQFGSVVCIECRDDGKWKVAWMITPALLHG